LVLRSQQPDQPERSAPGGGGSARGHGRLNLLVTYGGWRDAPAVEQLAQLLGPLGIESFNAESGEQAAEIIRTHRIHIAVVDLAIPLQQRETTRKTAAGRPGGGRILQVLRRLDPSPPTVIVRPPQAATRENVRSLNEALREGAFAVIDRPVQLETMLEVMRRVVRRHYKDHWPAA